MRGILGQGRASSVFVLACLALPLEAAQDINGTPILAVGQGVPVDVPSTYYTRLHPCPKACSTLKTPLDWTVYPSVERLEYCDQPMLIDFSIFNPLDDPTTGVLLKACTVGNGANTTVGPFVGNSTDPVPHRRATIRRDNSTSTSECMQIGDASQADFELLRNSDPAIADASVGILAVLQGLQGQFQDASLCERSSLFGYVNGASVGLYIANPFGKASIVSAIDTLVSEIQQNGASATMAAQLCNSSNNNNSSSSSSLQGGVVGISIDTTGVKSLAAVQQNVMTWAQGQCISSTDSAKSQLAGVTVWENTIGLAGNSTANNTTVPLLRGRSNYRLQRRDDCTTTTVASGDSCASLASKCGISASDFTKYNPASDLCSTLQPNQKVCCSAGTIPVPKENANGTCATYQVVSQDTCSSIALSNGITTDDINDFNKGKTWAWSGCSTLQAGINICLSNGTAPLPAPYENALCGPMKPGTTYPTGPNANVSELNPCPLNACCDIWGQCGITPEFCTIYKSPTDNPGYSPPGQNGCINNCEQAITNNENPPKEFGRVGYWESWNFDRPCANLRAEHANTDGSYTIIHWAFGTINETFNPVINDTYGQWAGFLALNSAKRVISFGGWGYSTDPSTYDVLREAMSPTNRENFADNIVAFLNDQNLDGVDFDWEYPGAPDIPGIPAGQADDGANYLKFLSTLRSKMPSGKTISIAAPASYWYLKQFPIFEMTIVLDYIVFMTYDLHGQWDYGNTFSVDGCPAGNCLRSHVNQTETIQALTMITKAGVTTNLIYVGESSYGRSFGMSDPNCYDANCTYTGSADESTAQPGECTVTAGYISNAEIYNLLETDDTAQTWYDFSGGADIMTWDNGQWVSFMSLSTKNGRRTAWEGYHFAGTVDWAVDLQNFDNDGGPGSDDDDDGADWLPPGDLGWTGCTSTYASLEDLNGDSTVPYWCSAQYLLQVLQANLTASLSAYDDLMSNGYDGKFSTYSNAVVKGAPQEVHDFVFANGNKYFTCEVVEATLCCDKCSQLGDDAPGACTYCFDGDCCDSDTSSKLKRDRPPPPTNGCDDLQHPKIEYLNVSEPCPPDYSKRGWDANSTVNDNTIYWSLDSDQSDQFYADLFDATGISKDNIALKDINRSECDPGESTADCQQQDWDIGIPAPQGYDASDVLNPKDTVSQAYNNLENLKGSELGDAITQIQNGNYPGSALDLVDALALPIFMISDAIDGMNQVVQVADEIDHEKMMAIIFGFLSAIFFFVPIAGEIASEVTALAGISRIAALAGAAGNAAMDIYQVVDEGGNAPLAIFDLITAPLALTDIAAIGKAASYRRGMSDSDLEGLGKVKEKLDVVEDIKKSGVCKLTEKRDVRTMPRDAMPISDLNAQGGMPNFVARYA